MYFFSGIFFAVALELYLILLLLHANEEEYKDYTEYDHISKSEPIEVKLGILKQQAQKKDLLETKEMEPRYLCHNCSKLIHLSKEEDQDSQYGEC